MFSESNRTKFWSHSFYLQNSGILQTKMDQSGPKWPKWITQTVRAQKVDEKMGSFVYSPFLSWVMVLTLPKIVYFLQICADLALSDIVCFIGVQATLHEILRNKY